MLPITALVVVSATSSTLVVGFRAIKKHQKKKRHQWSYDPQKQGIIRRKKRPRLVDFLIQPATEEVPNGKPLRSISTTWQTKLGALLPQAEASRQEGHEAEQEVNQMLGLSLSTMALFTAATFYAPLKLLAIPGLLYISIPVSHGAFTAVYREQRVNFYVLATVAQAALIVSGHYFLATLDYTLFYIAEKLVNHTQDHAKQSLISIFTEQPRTVWIIHNELEIEVSFEELKIGDVVVVSAGQTIAVDGIITDGYAYIDQHILTGESQPIEKEMGQEVFAGTVVLQGKIRVVVEKTGKATVAAQIGDLLNRTTDFKSGVQLKGEAFADKIALPLLTLGALAVPFVGYVGATAVLFSSIGDTIRITAPISILNFLQLTSNEGILIKDGRALELLSEVDTIVFDKTGTLTQEVPHVGAIYTSFGVSEKQLLSLAAAAEDKQSHPIAKAILKEAKSRGLTWPEIEETKYEVGFGLQVTIEQNVVLVGSQRFMSISGVTIPAEIKLKQSYCHENGYSLVYVAMNGELVGAIELHPTIRPEAKSVISFLKKRGLAIIIISGDHEEPTKKLASQLGVDQYFAETLPENKAELVTKLQKEGRAVCFVGDGINDSIALKKANVSVSLSGASSMAMDTASIILMDGSLNKLPALLDFATRLDANMKENFYISIVPGVVIIGGAFFLHFGVLSAFALFYVGLVTGVVNAMRPLIKYKSEK